MKIFIRILILTVLIVFSRCAYEGELVRPSQFPNTPKGNFDAFWTGIDQNYVFFDYTNVNWQKEYDTYKNQITPNTTRQELFNICKILMDKLIDGHRVLEAQSFSGENFPKQSIGVDQLKYFSEYPFIDTQFLLQNYLLQTNSVFGEDPTDGNLKEQIIYGKLKNENIGYVRMNFFGNALYSNSGNSDVTNFYNTINQWQDSQYNLILDLRLNSGGFLAEFGKLSSIFIDKTYEIGFSKLKLGLGNHNMSPYLTESLEPNKSAYFGRKIVILTNKFTVSASEITCIALKELPNVTILGEPTFGATGPLSEEKQFTGNFFMPNGWKITLAQRTTYDKNKNIFEGTGITPDIIVRQNIGLAQNSNIDNQLEEAISIIK